MGNFDAFDDPNLIHRHLMVKICEFLDPKLCPQNFQTFKEYCRGVLSQAELSAKYPGDFFIYLERKDLWGCNKYNVSSVRMFLRNIDVRIIDLIEEAERRIFHLKDDETEGGYMPKVDDIQHQVASEDNSRNHPKENLENFQGVASHSGTSSSQQHTFVRDNEEKYEEMLLESLTEVIEYLGEPNISAGFKASAAKKLKDGIRLVENRTGFRNLNPLTGRRAEHTVVDKRHRWLQRNGRYSYRSKITTENKHRKCFACHLRGHLQRDCPHTK